MKRSFFILLAVAVCLFAGCKKTTTPAPTPLMPAATADVIESIPTAAPDATLPGDTLAGDAQGLIGGMLSGFEEGKTVEQADVPNVVEAVKAKYPNATITSITYATHAGAQKYHVMLSGDAETTELYVDATGQITPYVAGTEDAAGGNANVTTP